MVYLARWKIVLIYVLTFLSLVYAAPNVLPASTKSWMQTHLPSFVPTEGVNLGLDLQGGSHLLLEVETNLVLEERIEALTDQLRADLRGAKIGYRELGHDKDTIRFTLTDPKEQNEAIRIARALETGLIQDRNDMTITLSMDEKYIKEKIRAAMEQSIEIVRRRIDETGTKEPSIQRQGADRILVQLPGVDDPERIKRLLGQTAKLTFRFVDENAMAAGTASVGSDLLDMTDQPGQKIAVQRRIMVSGDTLVDAQPSFSEGQPVVSFRFDNIGGKRFGEATRQNVGRLFAIVLDNKVISAPVIREPILGGSGIISGNFTVESAKDLALLLRAGALPAPITILEERTVGPGLGADSIRAGEQAALVGLILIVIFMFLSYGLFGFFANLALFINLVIIFAVLSILQATLTLPGIAGIALTIGTVVDANVLIFERMREESKLGRSVISAIDAGYSRAISAIIDANMTTVIAAVLLILLGSGPIKGFGVTLTVGLVASLFTAIMVTRYMIIVWYRQTKPKSLPI
jgi:preprotein translocase subunit SecD